MSAVQMGALAATAEAAGLAPIDLRFAELMQRRAASFAETAAFTAALLSRERGRGHACIGLADWAGRPFPDAPGVEAAWTAPGRADWEKQLAASGLAGSAQDATPWVCDGAGRVYLRRYFDAERRVAEALRGRWRQRGSDLAAAPGLDELFRALFPQAGADEAGADDRQAAAAAAALRAPVTLVSGGPGTGKTTTVTRILALLLAAEPGLRIALAAPTGKAAARLGESIADQLEALPVDAELRARIPTRASTIHRLLGYLPRRDRFRHHAGRPLAIDALVVDEASMVDLLLMDALLAALPASARLLLLGDRDQLASVETGSVFGDLCAAATLSPEDLSPEDLAPEAAALRDSAIELRHSYRFHPRSGIGALARAIREQDARGALAALADEERPDVDRRGPDEDPRTLLEPLLGDLDSYLAAESPAQALRRLERFRILCATHRGRLGVEGLDAAVRQELRDRGFALSDPWYRGRPIVITANDYQVRLFNGDLGVCWPEGAATHPDERLYAWFRSADDPAGLRRLPLARVPAHATAWAMTVHKSQGSEFDRVLMVLPETDMPLLTRELLYTGVTRARERLHLVAGTDVLRAAVRRRSRRASGLADALLGREPSSGPEAETPSAEPSGEPEQLSLF